MCPFDAVASGKSLDAELVKTWPQHAAVTGAGAISGNVRLTNEHRFAGLCEHTRRAQATEAATDNQYIDLIG